MPKPNHGGYLVVPGTDVVVPLPPVDTDTLEGRKEEARAIAAHPAMRALLEDANRDIAEGSTISAEELHRQLGIDEPSYDLEEDALYVPLSDGDFDREEQLDEWRRAAYAEDGTPVDVEVLRACEGVSLDGLPEPERIAAEARRFGLPVLPLPERITTG
ncbi:MAG: hypothetical protein ACRDI2_08190 [Chloroflexota bacterium]